MNSQSYQNIWSCVLRYVLFAHDLINFLLKKKKRQKEVGKRFVHNVWLRSNFLFNAWMLQKAKHDLSIYEPEWGVMCLIKCLIPMNFFLLFCENRKISLKPCTQEEKSFHYLFQSLKSVHEMWLGPSPSFDTLCKFIQTRNYVVSVFTVL